MAKLSLDKLLMANIILIMAKLFLAKINKVKLN
jgi:hypothetical protein